MRILVVEDDSQTALYLRKGLEEGGYIVDWTADGRDGLFMAASERYDLIVVDRMLPGTDGLSIVKILRSQGIRTPILILSALGQVDDRVRGLEAGADDYLVKPYAFSELMARVEALLRRGSAAAPDTVLRVGDLEMNLLSRSVTRAGQPIELKPREFCSCPG